MTVAKHLMSLATVGLDGTGPSQPREHGEPSRDGGSSSCGADVTLGLVSAVRPDDGDAQDQVDARAAEKLGIKHSSLAVSSPAGVVPLLQALGRTVATHAQHGYASLQEDPRFWTLVSLVQTLGHPSIAPLRSEEEVSDPGGDPFAARLDCETSDAPPKDLHQYPHTRRDL
jgi:hypothetical protein